MKKYIFVTFLSVLGTASFAQTQEVPPAAPQQPAGQPNAYYVKQIQGMSLDNLSQKDREKFEKGYANFSESAKMTPTPKLAMPSKDEINKKLIETGKK